MILSIVLDLFQAIHKYTFCFISLTVIPAGVGPGRVAIPKDRKIDKNLPSWQLPPKFGHKV